MIKKLMTLLIVALSSMVALSAMCEVQTIVLISVVESVEPQFAIRNTETGEIGQQVVFNTTEIVNTNVRTTFEIIQSNDSNYRGRIHFDITASELVAIANGKEYRTDGVKVMLSGRDTSSSCFDYEYTRNLKAGNVISTFDVVWATNQNLVDANYQALITLTYSAA